MPNTKKDYTNDYGKSYGKSKAYINEFKLKWFNKDLVRQVG